ncbi:MAG: 7-cyano-7-deazaguanine synthase QueC [Ignavibacteria bacterium]|nr:7-cyano-7-deazaguanine synthase QueC [Ignavibacteria bacterium]
MSDKGVNSNKKLAVVLASGGMDSCVTTAIAAQDYELAMLHLNYGQRTEKRELKAFNDLADYFKAKYRLVLDTDFFRKIGGSSLTDQNIEVSQANLNSTEIPSSYVPFRNANILAMAVAWAEVIGAEKIFIGAVEEDSSGYPDCRKIFYEKFNELIKVGTKPTTNITIETPIISMKKYEIVKKGIELNAPFHLTWSCYKDEDLACGVCDSCALRLRGFQLAGVEDPIPYRVKPKYI